VVAPNTGVGTGALPLHLNLSRLALKIVVMARQKARVKRV